MKTVILGVQSLSLVLCLVLGACASRDSSGNEVAVGSAASTAGEEPSSEPPSCVRAGCSKELCIADGEEPGASTCVWRPEFACYDAAECAVQPDGRCGWTPSAALRDCLDEARATPGGNVLK